MILIRPWNNTKMDAAFPLPPDFCQQCGGFRNEILRGIRKPTHNKPNLDIQRLSSEHLSLLMKRINMLLNSLKRLDLVV